MAGSVAHARALHAAGLLDDEQLHAVEDGLGRIAEEFLTDRFNFKPSDEDIHTAVERRLTELRPKVGGRLHAGRSRNDQIALDLRLYCRDSAVDIALGIGRVVAALVSRASEHADWAMPGYTHLQRAQPVTVGHHLMAHAEPLLRDAQRVRRAYDAADSMPLGAGALAGRTLSIPREVVARELHFSDLSRNSMDAVSDRDFVLDLVYACLSVGLHLSRLAEDVVLWASAEFGFVKLVDQIATGSSLMPQKKNPDIAELIRGRTGRALGSLTALATVLKGLPLAYDRDLQEDKVALISAVNNCLDCLTAADLLIQNLEFDRRRLRAALADPDLLATDSAEKLVSEGVPFREAHRRVAQQVGDGAHNPPWDAARSLELRNLDVAGQAAAARARLAQLADWAEEHSFPLPVVDVPG